MWPRTAAELIRIQDELASAEPEPWRLMDARPLVAGVFVCFARGGTGRGHAGEPGWAAAVLIHADRHVLATAVVRGEAAAPYEPGLMALREGPLLERAVRALGSRAEVLLVNATGRDHPRGAGVALHLGAVLDLPSVGVTDRPLVGLVADGVEVARLVRTRAGARPVVVHPGWRTDLDTAVGVVRAATRRARTPEPLRRARTAARGARAASAE
jgi:deoxyribonuclease V